MLSTQSSINDSHYYSCLLWFVSVLLLKKNDNAQFDINGKSSHITINSFNKDCIRPYAKSWLKQGRFAEHLSGVFKFSGPLLMMIPGMNYTYFLFACLTFSLQNSANVLFQDAYSDWTHSSEILWQILRLASRKFVRTYSQDGYLWKGAEESRLGGGKVQQPQRRPQQPPQTCFKLQ